MSDASDGSSEDETARRYPSRRRVAPLEYWRGEKFVYGRRESGRAVVPIVKEVLRMPKEEVKRLGSAAARGRSVSKKPTKKEREAAERKKKKGKSKARGSDSESGSGEDGEEDERGGGVPVEAGWDKDTLEHGVVWVYVKKQEIERREQLFFSSVFDCFSICRISHSSLLLSSSSAPLLIGIAFPSHLVEYRTMSDNPTDFKFQKVFGDASFVAAGMLEIPVGGEKPSKPTKDNTYVRRSLQLLVFQVV
jgi:centromere protein C